MALILTPLKWFRPRIVHSGCFGIAIVKCVGAIRYHVLRFFVYYTVWSRQWRLYWRLTRTHNTQPLKLLNQLLLKIMSLANFFIYALHNYEEWLNVHIHCLPRIQDVVIMVVQYFEVTGKLRIFLPHHAGTHTHTQAHSCTLNKAENMRHKHAQVLANTRNRIAYRHTQLHGDAYIRKNTLTPLYLSCPFPLCTNNQYINNIGEYGCVWWYTPILFIYWYSDTATNTLDLRVREGSFLHKSLAHKMRVKGT
jgi:hypothetical protein